MLWPANSKLLPIKNSNDISIAVRRCCRKNWRAGVSEKDIYQTSRISNQKIVICPHVNFWIQTGKRSVNVIQAVIRQRDWFFVWIIHLICPRFVNLLCGMKSFLTKLWKSDLKRILPAMLVLLAGTVVNVFANKAGQLTLPAQTATELLIFWASSLFAVCGVAFGYWEKCQPSEQVRRALEQGRPICHCTTDGAVMLLDTKNKGSLIQRYLCPACQNHIYKQRQ